MLPRMVTLRLRRPHVLRARPPGSGAQCVVWMWAWCGCGLCVVWAVVGSDSAKTGDLALAPHMGCRPRFLEVVRGGGAVIWVSSWSPEPPNYLMGVVGGRQRAWGEGGAQDTGPTHAHTSHPLSSLGECSRRAPLTSSTLSAIAAPSGPTCTALPSRVGQAAQPPPPCHPAPEPAPNSQPHPASRTCST